MAVFESPQHAQCIAGFQQLQQLPYGGIVFRTHGDGLQKVNFFLPEESVAGALLCLRPNYISSAALLRIS